MQGSVPEPASRGRDLGPMSDQLVGQPSRRVVPGRLGRVNIPNVGNLMPRAVVAFAALAVLLLVSGTAAPVAVAECMATPDADTRVERPIVFTATVGGVTTEPDLASAEAGEDPGVLWQTTMDVRTVHGGNVPGTLELHGSTSNVGVGGGCSWFLGDRVETGDVVFVAVDEVIPFATNTSLFGHLLLWRRVGDEWRFYERALQDGGEPDAYPEVARQAHTTEEVLAVVERLGLPETATIEPRGPSIFVLALLLGAAVGGAAWSIKFSRGRE